MSPNSYWQTFALFLRHPTTIATVASVGMHATIGVALPTLPFFTTGGGGGGTIRPRNVQLIELTPAEVSRLPQLYTPPQREYAFDLPNAPESEYGLPLFEAEAIPRQQDRRPPENLGRSRSNLPPRPDGVGAPLARPSRSLRDFAAIDRTVRQRTRTTQNRNRNLPAPRTENIPTLSDSTARNERSDRERRLRQELFGPDIYAFENNDRAQLPTRDLDSLAAAGLAGAKVENLQPNVPPTPERPLSPQELAARQRENANVDRMTRLREDYRRNPDNTSPEAARENESRWLAETRPSRSSAQLRRVTIQGAYPTEACINRARGTAIYGVIVQPNGSKTDVQQIRSTGYRILDRVAIAQISGAGLGTESVPVPYRVTIPFNYNADICPTLATPARPTPAAAPSPTPAAVPSPPAAPPSPSPAAAPSSSPTPVPIQERSPSATPTESTSPSPMPESSPTKKPKTIPPNPEE
ncbi:MAG: TonB family protein [Cyanobacteria bacterium P01_E01_bin.42]